MSNGAVVFRGDSVRGALLRLLAVYGPHWRQLAPLTGGVPAYTMEGAVRIARDALAAPDMTLDTLRELVNACTPPRLPSDQYFAGVQPPDKALLERARAVVEQADAQLRAAA